MWTVELTADYHHRSGRVVTDLHRHRVTTIGEALAITDAHWARVSRRRGVQLHVRYTGDAGAIVTKRFRRD